MESIQQTLGELPIVLCALSVAEIGHGIYRANTEELINLPLADLIIGATAVELGYAVATSNLRHFNRIPGLRVVQL